MPNNLLLSPIHSKIFVLEGGGRLVWLHKKIENKRGCVVVGRMNIIVGFKFQRKAEEKNYCKTYSDVIKFYYHNNKLLAPWYEWLWARHAHHINFPNFSALLLSSIWCALVKNLIFSRSRRKTFPLSLRRPPHCLCDTTRSLLVRLSFAQHKSRVMFTIFFPFG